MATQNSQPATNLSFDYIIVGGGTAGCVIASRLKEHDPHFSVAIFETGLDGRDHPLVTSTWGAPLLPSQTNFVVTYETVPQKQLNGRSMKNQAGQMLSGSTGVNYGAWMRGHVNDYDLWAKQLNDPRWSYEGLLPYFRRVENYHDSKANPKHHGFEGKIHTLSGSSRKYPLSKPIHDGLVQAGYEDNQDFHNGNPLGLGPWVENWYQNSRQPAGTAYDLSGVRLETSATVARVTFSEKKATGIELVDGRHFTARKEVIICCGAHRTPQLLLLSGIGPTSELQKHNIPQVIDSPHVGQNLFDHLVLFQAWKLRNPHLGLATGHSTWNKPEYLEGMPIDWAAGETADQSTLKAVLERENLLVSNEALVTQAHAHTGHFISYVVFGGFSFELPIDGTYICTGTILYQPTSRGTVTVSSSNPSDPPVVDPRYYTTEADKFMLRSALRRFAKVMESAALQEHVESEHVDPAMPRLTSTSSDDDIDARVRAEAAVIYHAAGTAAMGKVVDSDLRVVGLDALRVVDASVFPTPVAGYTQQTVYAVAELASDIILGKNLRT